MLLPVGVESEGSTTSFTVSPAFIKFTKSSALQGQFVINVVGTTVTGEYSLFLNITGSIG
jgi:hypothetical protein